MKKVIVAMSGGVDSSVAAALLQQQGYDVEGIFMKNWSPDTLQSLTDCPWEQDQADAQAVCEKLGIPFRSINFEKEYKERVVDYFFREYAAGRTPNPDVMCNKEIKFRVFLDEAKKLGADLIATGHYAQLGFDAGHYFIKKAIDPGKEQSYFLWTLQQEQLAKVMFPIGEYPKSKVREMAREFGLPTAEKKDSQGICFIGHIDLKQLLQEHITTKPGEVRILPEYVKGVSLEDRKKEAVVVGTHQGSMFYTLGERANSVLDNGKYRATHNNSDVPPVYVLTKDFEDNILFITKDRTDPQLLSRTILLQDCRFEPGIKDVPLTIQVRYHQHEEIHVDVTQDENGITKIHTQEPMWAATEGQSAVLYHKDRLMGGGIVAQVVPGE